MVLGAGILPGCGSNLDQRSAPYNTQNSFGRGAGNSTAAPGGSGRLPSQFAPGASQVAAPIELILRVPVDEAVGPSSSFAGDWDAFAKWAADRGFTTLSVYAIDPAASGSNPAAFHFPDVTFSDGSRLSDQFSQGSYNIAALATAAHSRNLRVEADLTALALPSRGASSGARLSPDQIGELCQNLIANAHVDLITARGFPPEWVDAAAPACQSAGGYFIDGGSEILSAPKIAEAVAGISRTGRDGRDLVANELAATLGRQASLPIWAGVSYRSTDEPDSPLHSAWQSNKYVASAILYMALLSRPDGLVFDLPISVLDSLSGDLIQQAKQYAARADSRPQCNVLVIGQVGLRDIAAAVNGITAAGYDAVFSPKPLSAADAYYVIAGKNAGAGRGQMEDLPTEVVAVFSSAKVAFLQVGGAFPAAGAHAGWDGVRRAFGLDTTDYPEQEKPVVQGKFHDVTFPFGASPQQSSGAWGSLITTPHLVAAKAECTGLDEFQDVVLIASHAYGSQGMNVLVNGAALDLQASFPISNLLAKGGGLQAPTTALCLVGPTSAFFAAQGDTTVKIKLKGPDSSDTERKIPGGEIVVIEPSPT